MNTTTATEIRAALTRFANADIRSAQKHGSHLIGRMKCGTVELTKSRRGHVLVDRLEMTVANAREFLIANYDVVTE